MMHGMARNVVRIGAAILVAAATSLSAQEFRPGVIYAVGQKFDKSFNEAAHEGSQRFKAETGIDTLEFEPQSPAQFEQGVNGLARRGVTDIVAVGFYYATPLAEVAPKHPNIRFTLIDSVADRLNVRSVVFKEHEGAFLAGMLAAMTSTSGRIGFVGAMDIPLLRKFAVGYEEGARYGRPSIQVIVNFIGTTPAAFSDPTAGRELARSQIDRGADVIFAGAGASNLGVFQQAVDSRKLAIGVDANQNGLHPGHILTSQLKRVDLAVLTAFRAGRDGTWRPGVVELGLKEDGVGLAFDAHNATLVPPDRRARIDQARNDIIAGRIKVTDATKR
jgi:basic membrane protein A